MDLRIIIQNNDVQAVVLPTKPTAAEMRVIRSIWPDFPAYPVLAKRWSVYAVLCRESWNHGNPAREPRSVKITTGSCEPQHHAD